MTSIVGYTLHRNDNHQWCFEAVLETAGTRGEPLIERVRVTWPRDHVPTSDELTAAQKMATAIRDPLSGQRMRTRRIGPFQLLVSTGPPTFWLPRARLRNRGVYVGWGRCLVGARLIGKRSS